MPRHDPFDPAVMSVDDRIDELAALLAVGYLRLKRRTGCLPPAESTTAESAESLKTSADSTCNPLENSPLCQSR